MKAKDFERAQIWLPYFKQGDDMSACLESSKGDILKALDEHRELMLATADQLQGIKEVLIEKGTDKVEMEAMTHFIGIFGPKEVIQALLDKELVSEDPFDEDEEDFDDFAEDDESCEDCGCERGCKVEF